jgi:hypothetical protein
MLIAVGIAAVLSGIAYPSLESQVHAGRRSDALASLMQASCAGAAPRRTIRSYGDRGRDRRAPTSLLGPLRDRGRGSAADGYELVATATGRQAHDARCRTLRSSSPAAASSTPRARTPRRRTPPPSIASVEPVMRARHALAAASRSSSCCRAPRSAWS